jgi:hypothetical protein
MLPKSTSRGAATGAARRGSRSAKMSSTSGGPGPFSPPGNDRILWFTGMASAGTKFEKKSESAKAWPELYRKLELEGRPVAGAGGGPERGGGKGAAAAGGAEEKRGRG